MGGWEDGETGGRKVLCVVYGRRGSSFCDSDVDVLFIYVYRFCLYTCMDLGPSLATVGLSGCGNLWEPKAVFLTSLRGAQNRNLMITF